VSPVTVAEVEVVAVFDVKVVQVDPPLLEYLIA
jgi:hypothetical protein